MFLRANNRLGYVYIFNGKIYILIDRERQILRQYNLGPADANVLNIVQGVEYTLMVINDGQTIAHIKTAELGQDDATFATKNLLPNEKVQQIASFKPSDQSNGRILVLTNTGNARDYSPGRTSGGPLSTRISASSRDRAGSYSFTQIATGSTHALLLDDTGRVFSRGDNISGQLGRTHHDRYPYSAYSHARLPDRLLAKHIAAGANHSVVVSQDGRLYVCGDNSHGQLGLPRDNVARADYFQSVGELDTVGPITAATATDNLTAIIAGGKVYATGTSPLANTQPFPNFNNAQPLAGMSDDESAIKIYSDKFTIYVTSNAGTLYMLYITLTPNSRMLLVPMRKTQLETPAPRDAAICQALNCILTNGYSHHRFVKYCKAIGLPDNEFTLSHKVPAESREVTVDLRDLYYAHMPRKIRDEQQQTEGLCSLGIPSCALFTKLTANKEVVVCIPKILYPSWKAAFKLAKNREDPALTGTRTDTKLGDIEWRQLTITHTNTIEEYRVKTNHAETYVESLMIRPAALPVFMMLPGSSPLSEMAKKMKPFTNIETNIPAAGVTAKLQDKKLHVRISLPGTLMEPIHQWIKGIKPGNHITVTIESLELQLYTETKHLSFTISHKNGIESYHVSKTHPLSPTIDVIAIQPYTGIIEIQPAPPTAEQLLAIKNKR
tara:strand:- start:137 stop:2131 length:1995 start_codon:yes stop_codon:yes gene_type:complete